MASSLLFAPPTVAAPGELDRSFGQGGESVFQANPACRPGCVEFAGSYAHTLTVEADGKIVLGGRNEYIGAFPRGKEPATSLVRLDPNGAIDTSFGTGGLVEGLPFEILHTYEAPHGRLLAIGRGANGVGVESYTSAEIPDTTYAQNGVRWFSTPRQVKDAIIDTAGRVVVLTSSFPPSAIMVMRFLPMGDPDPTFGSNGIARLHGLPAF